MVVVYPGAKNLTHEISLSDGIKKWGIKLEEDELMILEEPIIGSSILNVGSDQRFGDQESGISHIEQRTWIGGNTKNYQIDNPNGFSEGIGLWSIADGKLMPAPQWNFGQGIIEDISKSPGNMNWISMKGNKQFVEIPINVSGPDINILNVNLWVKKIGSPGDLSLGIYSDDNGFPDQLVNKAEILIDDKSVEDLLCKLLDASFSSSILLTSGVSYHIVIQPVQVGTAASHWLMGVDREDFSAKISEDGDLWMDAEFNPYFRLTEKTINREWKFFNFESCLYAVDQRKDGQASNLFINGDRGKATSGSSTALIDSDKDWALDIWGGDKKSEGQLKDFITSGLLGNFGKKLIMLQKA